MPLSLQIPLLLSVAWHHAVIHASVQASHSSVIPRRVWTQSGTSQFSVSTDSRHLSEGTAPRLSDKTLHPDTFTKEIGKWCQKHSVHAQKSLYKRDCYYYIMIPTLATIPEEGAGCSCVFFGVFFAPERPPTTVVMISFVCIVLFKSVSLWDGPPTPSNRSAVLQITTSSSDITSFPSKAAARHSFPPSSYYIKSFLGPWNVKAGGVQWEN